MKFHQVIERHQGWSDWEFPVMSGYKMACCDCGLVHDMRFVAIKILKQKRNGAFMYQQLGPGKFRIAIKARRNKRLTGQMRRNKSGSMPMKLR